MLESKSRTGTDKLKTYVILNGNFLSLSCPSATFALQHGGFVPLASRKGVIMESLRSKSAPLERLCCQEFLTDLFEISESLMGTCILTHSSFEFLLCLVELDRNN